MSTHLSNIPILDMTFHLARTPSFLVLETNDV